jgi:hypothetical protein
MFALVRVSFERALVARTGFRSIKLVRYLSSPSTVSTFINNQHGSRVWSFGVQVLGQCGVMELGVCRKHHRLRETAILHHHSAVFHSSSVPFIVHSTRTEEETVTERRGQF